MNRPSPKIQEQAAPQAFISNGKVKCKREGGGERERGGGGGEREREREREREGGRWSKKHQEKRPPGTTSRGWALR